MFISCKVQAVKGAPRKSLRNELRAARELASLKWRMDVWPIKCYVPIADETIARTECVVPLE